jgi:hypothetical protein
LPIKGLENNRNLEFLFGTESSCFLVVFSGKKGWNSLALALAWFMLYTILTLTHNKDGHMKTKTYNATYGIKEVNLMTGKRFFVLADGKQTSLNYAKAAYALKQAKIFIHACHKPFFREQDQTNVIFTFTQDDSTVDYSINS